MELLRFLTCGSVDDGKSTLIGRLLYDSQNLYEDQLLSLEKEQNSKGELDFALLLDGLLAEREQGITIDVAYRYFSTGKRKFIVADTPGHEQYTRNMVTGASTAEVGIVLVDASKGILPQTKRHTYILELMQVKVILLAINKMDLVGFSEEVFNKISHEYVEFTQGLGLNITIMPLSAKLGDNVFRPSSNLGWYQGKTFIEYLETVPTVNLNALELRFPVQFANRLPQGRGFVGTISSGQIKLGEPIMVAASRLQSRVKSIFLEATQYSSAMAKQAVTITLEDEIDISRGDILVSPHSSINFNDRILSKIVWLNEKPLGLGNSYILLLQSTQVKANLTEIHYKMDINTKDLLPCQVVQQNEIAMCRWQLSNPIAFDSFKQHPHTGSFILIDPLSSKTVAAGIIPEEQIHSSNLTWQQFSVTDQDRARLKQQTPCVLWFTGLSGTGKSTIANLLESYLLTQGKHTMILDGDNLRHGLCQDLGFNVADRTENIRRFAYVAQICTQAGLITLVTLISPFAKDRAEARKLFAPHSFFEIYVDTPLSECMKRDVKGLYAKNAQQQLTNFTGISSPYEPPVNPDLRLDTLEKTPEELCQDIIAFLQQKQILN